MKKTVNACNVVRTQFFERFGFVVQFRDNECHLPARRSMTAKSSRAAHRVAMATTALRSCCVTPHCLPLYCYILLFILRFPSPSCHFNPSLLSQSIFDCLPVLLSTRRNTNHDNLPNGNSNQYRNQYTTKYPSSLGTTNEFWFAEHFFPIKLFLSHPVPL